MKSKKDSVDDTKDYINPEFADLFEFSSNKSEIQHEARVIMYRFLSEVERLSEEKKINKKELAKLIGTSASFITQLFKGTKLLNLETAAKLQRAFDVKFDIKAYPKDAVLKGCIIYTTIIQVNPADVQYNYDYDETQENPILFSFNDKIKSPSFTLSTVNP